MTYSEIQDQIVSNFWSEGLKKHIRDTGYVFPPEKLLCIAYKQTPNFTERLERMKLFADHVPGAADHARLVIAWMEGWTIVTRAPRSPRMRERMTHPEIRKRAMPP